MRALIVYFALAGMLLCPYNCAVQAAVLRGPVNQHHAKACCEHCRAKQAPQDRASQDKNSSDRPGPAKDGRSCACAGAVFDASVRTPVDTLLVSSHGALAVDSAVQHESIAPGRIMSTAAGPPLAWDGRQLRIVMVSFLL